MKYWPSIATILTVGLNYIWLFWYSEDWDSIPRVEHWNGNIGYYINWHVYILSIHFNMIILGLVSLSRYVSHPINRVVIRANIFWLCFWILDYSYGGIDFPGEIDQAVKIAIFFIFVLAGLLTDKQWRNH